MGSIGAARARPSILYFSNHLRGPTAAAGARTWHQAKRLSDDFDVTVVIPAIDPVTAQPVSEETYGGLDHDTVSVVPVETTVNDRNSLWTRFRYFLSAMRGAFDAGIRHRKVDIVMSMGLPVTLLLVAWIMSLWHRARFVVDVRDMPFDTAFEIGYIKSRFVVAVARGLESFLLRRADAVLTNSPRYKPALARRGVASDRITVALIGYDNFPPPADTAISQARQSMLEKLDPATEFIGVYAGTIGHAFPVDTILEGARLLREDRRLGFVFLGDGQRLEEFRQFAQEYGLNAVFVGRVSKNEVSTICRASDYCLYPAATGEFSGAILGNKVFDYLGALKPVVYVGRDSAVRDLLQEVDAGLYAEPGDTETFAANVASLLSDENLRARLSGNARSAILERGFTAQASAEVLAGILEGLCRPSGKE